MEMRALCALFSGQVFQWEKKYDILNYYPITAAAPAYNGAGGTVYAEFHEKSNQNIFYEIAS